MLAGIQDSNGEADQILEHARIKAYCWISSGKYGEIVLVGGLNEDLIVMDKPIVEKVL